MVKLMCSKIFSSNRRALVDLEANSSSSSDWGGWNNSNNSKGGGYTNWYWSNTNIASSSDSYVNRSMNLQEKFQNQSSQNTNNSFNNTGWNSFPLSSNFWNNTNTLLNKNWNLWWWNTNTSMNINLNSNYNSTSNNFQQLQQNNSGYVGQQQSASGSQIYLLNENYNWASSSSSVSSVSNTWN